MKSTKKVWFVNYGLKYHGRLNNTRAFDLKREAIEFASNLENEVYKITSEDIPKW